MKKEINGFVAGVVTTALLFTTVFTAFAEPYKKSITAVYNNIKIFVDGNLVQPKDANGNKVDPFTYNGTTYLPVRAISEALGKKVSWDSNSNSVYIGQKPAQEIKEIIVSTSEEFIKAIGSNKKILLKPGTYNLSNLPQTYNDNKQVFWKAVHDGNELIIQDIYNFTIEGTGDTPSEIIVEPRYAYVLNFINADNVKIKNIKAGHTEKGYCMGGVYSFEDSQNIEIDESELYGCGTEGLYINNVQQLKFTNSKIFECTYDIMTINNSQNIEFVKSSFTNNQEFDLINIYQSSNISFDECDISNNETGYDSDYSFYDYSLFNVGLSSGVVVKNSKIENNKSVYLLNNKDSVVFENTDIINNTFYKGEYLK